MDEFLGTQEEGATGVTVPNYTVPGEEIQRPSVNEDYFNLMNPTFGVRYRTGLNNSNPEVSTWTPDETEWVKELSIEDKMAISKANSEEYALEIMARRAIYKDSEKAVMQDSMGVQLGMSLFAGAADPSLLIPIGGQVKAAGRAYSVGAKMTELAKLSAASAALGITSVSANLNMQQASGVDRGTDYGMLNLYAGLLGGGLPVLGSVLSGGYQTAKVASSLTTDPKNFLALTGELTADKLGGTQLRTLYTKVVPDFLQSDVTMTAASDNPFITLVSNRIDSPPMAVVSRETGKPVPLGTTGQDYKLKFNGKARLMYSDLRALYTDSTFNSLDDFHIEVGKVVRDRAVRQEHAVYDELNDIVDFTTNEAKMKQKAEYDKFTSESWFKRDSDNKLIPATENDIILHKEGQINLESRKPNKKEIPAFERDLEERINLEIESKIDSLKEELYNKNQLEFVHNDPKIVEASKQVDAYYGSVLDEGKKLKIHELRGLTKDRHYMTRIFDFQKIGQLDTQVLNARIGQALKSHVANKGLSEEQLAKGAADITAQLKKLDYDKNFADYSFMVPKELGATSFLKSKKFKLDDRVLDDLLITNIEDVVGQYNYSQVGHFAANHSFPEVQGIPREQQLDKFRADFIEPLRAAGTGSTKEAKQLIALENMFSDLLGTFRVAKDSNSAVWKGTRLANSFNSLTYGGGFALNTAAELGGLLLDGHVSNVMKARLGSLKEIGTMFTGKGVEDPLVRDFVLMGQLENLFESHNMMKMSDTDTVFNVGKVENAINKGTNEFFKYNGLRGATVALEAMVGPRVIHDILDFGKLGTLSSAQEKYMARIGLSHADVNKISKHLDKVGTFHKGAIYDLNLDKWGDDLLDKLTTGIERGMRHTVIKGDTTYLPSFMIKPNAFNRLAFQFLRYPMAATETLMARGMNENTAKWMAATSTSAFMMGMVLYGREQAGLAIGAIDEYDTKYANFWEDDEAAMKLFTAGMAKAGTLGGAGILVDRLSAVSGVPTPGSEFVNKDVLSAIMGPTFGRAPQMRNILEPLLTEGRIDSKQQWNAMMGLMPGATFPIISEYLRTQIKENTY